VSEVSRLSLLPEGAAQVLDRYQLIGEIASGGMASVFLARLGGVGGFSRMVAIKRLHPHLAGEPEFVEMFLDEARLAASIHHRNVVPILEIGSSALGYYLVMEYIEGVTLAKLMTHATVTRRPVPRPVLLRVAIDTLSGLHAAHELTDENDNPLGVVHRDCSPQNILIGLDGCTRITDFGIARASSRLHTTREGAMKGKLAYMAPEQTQGDGFDRRADLFSVGVVLWEILAEARLFKGSTEAETLKRLLHDPIPALRSVVDDVPAALDAVCARALARDPKQRFATAAEMADAIETAARQSGLRVASEREVEALMKERYGAAAVVQRDAVRNWLQASSLGGPLSEGGWRDRSAVASRPGHVAPGVGMAPPASARVPMTGRGWPPEAADEALAGFEPTPRTFGAPVEHPPRALETEIDAATIELPPKPADSETTNIYDPPSASGNVLSLTGQPSSPTYSDPKPSLPMQRARTPWLLAVAAVLAVITAAVVVLRTTRGLPEPASREPESEVAQTKLSEAETTEAEADVASNDEATEPSEPAASASAEPKPTPVAKRPPLRPPPKAAPEPPPKTAKPPAPKLPDEADDLSNPYR
jgi:eukaryotic-like serine/threonine-protein kinase